MKPIEFAIVGAGWRAEFFLRIARTLPDRFRIAGMAVRNGEKGKAVEAAWGVSTFRDIDGLLAPLSQHSSSSRCRSRQRPGSLQNSPAATSWC
jgi:hypothetical protein